MTATLTEEEPNETIKSKITDKKTSGDSPPAPDVKIKLESQTSTVQRELTAQEKALEKRMKLKRELEEMRKKDVKKVRKF